MEIACYSLLLTNIANRAITKLSRFKIYDSVPLIFRKQAPLIVDNGHICLYGGLFEINKMNNNQNQLCIACGR